MNDSDDSQDEPQSGPEVRHVNVSEGDGVVIKESIRLRDREGPGKRFIEQRSGDDLQRSTGKWLKLLRIIDHKNDHYLEELKDPETGEILRRCDEPLSEHRDHGAAKKKNASD
jgi:hypothetical protein